MAKKPQSDNEQKPEVIDEAASEAKSGKLLRLKRWICTHKKVTIPGAVVLLLVVLAAVPLTRYAILGLFWKKQYTVHVVDAETKRAVSTATVRLHGATATTDAHGHARLNVPVGSAKLTVEKKYYKNTTRDLVVPIGKQKQAEEVSLKATGRQVSVTVINKITKKPLESVTIAAADTTAKTDKEGKAVLVLPADKQTVEATLNADSFNQVKGNITVTTDEKANVLALTPAGQLYFLSNLSGKLDVVKANLDGTARQTVLAGTGKEEKRGTVLLASRDWKYLALLSKRDGGENAKLFLIEAGTDKATVMDEGDATFTLVGWSDHRFVYTVERHQPKNGQPNKYALKAYDAQAKKITTLDQSAGEGDGNYFMLNYFANTYILKNELVYIKQWQSGYNNYAYAGYQAWVDAFRAKKTEIRSVRPDGSNNHLVKAYDHPQSGGAVGTPVASRLYEPQEIWLKTSDNATEEYAEGKIKPVTNVSYDEFYETYPTYLLSPSGERTLWSESRDGKSAIFTGNANGEDEQQIASLSNYATYGWYTDQYLLVSKNASELYIMPASGGEVLKLTDYYKPDVNFAGYGYGYGGL